MQPYLCSTGIWTVVVFTPCQSNFPYTNLDGHGVHIAPVGWGRGGGGRGALPAPPPEHPGKLARRLSKRSSFVSLMSTIFVS